MGLFKTAEEKKIEQQMIRDEQMQVFNDQINSLKNKRTEYARIAAEAEIAGDEGTYEVACNALMELNDTISSLTQTKANFDVINVSNAIAQNMSSAINALNAMAGQKNALPNLRKIQKVNVRVNKYMRQVKISNKAMGSAMKSSNPANRARSDAELASIKPLIDAQRSKISGVAMPAAKSATLDIASEIEAEKAKLK